MRSYFIAFCAIIAILTLTLLDLPILQAGLNPAPSHNRDLNINVNVPQNYSLGNVRTEIKDGKLEVIFEVKTVLDLGPYSVDTVVDEIQTVLNQSTVLRKTRTIESNKTVEPKKLTETVQNQKKVLPKTPTERNKIVETKKQTPKINSTTNNISELPKKRPLTIYDNPYTINNKDVCNHKKPILFLVLVHTATDHFEWRQALRNTWANVTLYQTHQMRIVFLLGIPKNESLNAKIQRESTQHGDIVQGNFIDDYHNLTHKGVMGLRWVTENCRQAKFIVKIDDDAFVNTLLLIENFLGTFWNSSRSIMGTVIRSAWISRKGKHEVAKEEFVNMKRFPFPYSPGLCVILTNDIIEELYNAAKGTAFFWIDDVYLFGKLPHIVGNITHVHLESVTNFGQTAIKCFAATEKKCDILAASSNSTEGIDKMWRWSVLQNAKLAVKYLSL